MVLASPALQHARVHHVLGQGVLEAVHQLRLFRGWEDEIEAVELPQAPGHLIRTDLEDAREERDAEAPAYHRRPLQRVLLGFREPIDARRDDVVDRGRNRHVGAAELRLAVLDHDAARLLQLPDDLLHVQRIPLALVGQDLVKLLGDVLRAEQGQDHAADVAGRRGSRP